MTRIYRASELGGCIKAQVAKHLDFTPVEKQDFWDKYGERGRKFEAIALSKLEKEWGAVLNFPQAELDIEILPNVIVQGHVDSFWDDEVVEVKSMSTDEYNKWVKTGWDTPGLIQRYKWQISCYMVAAGAKGKLIVLECKEGDEPGNMTITNIPEPFYSREQIMSRVLEIERYVRLGELPDECSVQQFPCPWFYLHDQTSIELMEDDTIDALAGEYDAARLAVKVAETRKKTAQTALVTALGSRKRVDTAAATVALTHGFRTTLDRDRLQKTLENMEDSLTAYESKKPYMYVRVKMREAGDEISS